MGTALLVAFASVPVVVGILWVLVALFDRVTHRFHGNLSRRDRWGESLAWMWNRN